MYALVHRTKKFARRLSVRSIEWSGNFSQEEYVALARNLSGEDTRGLITLDSFKNAVEVGSATLAAEKKLRRREKHHGVRTAATRDAQNVGVGVNKNEVRSHSSRVIDGEGIYKVHSSNRLVCVGGAGGGPGFSSARVNSMHAPPPPPSD